MKKALVVYGTRWGTAADIAEEIARVIKEEGIEVDLADARKIKHCDVTPYDLVVVGSGIKMGKWTKKSLKFLKNNKSALAHKKVALFVSCGAANDEKTAEEGWEKYLKAVAAEYLEGNPVDLGLYGSVYDPEANHGLLFKLTSRFIKKELEDKGLDPNIRHDYRDWDEIRSWARGLANKLNE